MGRMETLNYDLFSLVCIIITFFVLMFFCGI